jgi:pimeloyl-ACP methyl ester carboxylesterase
MASKPTIVFAHGLWADGSCFSKVIEQLQAEGYECLASQHGLDSLASDVACVTRCVARATNPVLLVGHSYGGTLITHAGTDDRVRGLVYISALGPDETETSQSEQEKFPTTEVFQHIEIADGRIWLLASGIKYFAGDLPEDEQKLVWAVQAVPVADVFTQKLDGIAWRSKPSWYIVANGDQTVHPDLERAAAQRMRARTFDIDSSREATAYIFTAWPPSQRRGSARRDGRRQLSRVDDPHIVSICTAPASIRIGAR